jgi:glutaredoxin
MAPPLQITLYSTTGCCFCKKVADVLDGLGVVYNLAHLDGQASGRHKASLRRRGITILAVPVLIVGEKVYRPPDLIDEVGNVKDTLPSLVGKNE